MIIQLQTSKNGRTYWADVPGIASMQAPGPNSSGRVLMASQVFSNLGVTVDRRLHEFADSYHHAVDRIKKKSLQGMYEDTRDWIYHNPGKVVVGAMATGFLIGRFLRRPPRR